MKILIFLLTFLAILATWWACSIKFWNRTDIPSLKIGYNKVFGYYIEITKTHIDKVPENYIRKQTLTNAERYFTEELKEYENQILSAEDKINALELEIFNDLRSKLFMDTDNDGTLDSGYKLQLFFDEDGDYKVTFNFTEGNAQITQILRNSSKWIKH